MKTLPLVALLLLAGCAAPAASALPPDLAAVINGPDYANAHWGILVADLASGKTLHELNADKLFAPASVTKLYTVAAALDALGADHRFETPVYRRGDPDRDGDLILVASGDLTLGGRSDAQGHVAFTNSDHTYAGFSETAELTAPDPLAGLKELARQVAAAGIKRVRGDVIVDDRLFDPAEGSGSGPSQITPILVNDNVIDFVITPAVEAGKPATLTWRPETSAFRVEGQVLTAVSGEARVSVEVPSPGKLVVRGQIPVGRKPLVRIHEVDDPASFARTLFIECLQKAGVAVDASPAAANPRSKLPGRKAADAVDRIATFTSPPFSEHARLILKVSHNLHASTLPLILAARKGARKLEDGMRLQHDFLARAGVDVETISFGGGAGGSRADYTTPRATVQLLRHMAGRGDFPVYGDALPVLGVDGTLATVVGPASPARGRVRAKTGTLLWHNTMNSRFLLTSKALAGYMTTASGRKLAFAFFVNNTHLERSADSAREGKALGRLCEILCGDE